MFSFPSPIVRQSAILPLKPLLVRLPFSSRKLICDAYMSILGLCALPWSVFRNYSYTAEMVGSRRRVLALRTSWHEIRTLRFLAVLTCSKVEEWPRLVESKSLARALSLIQSLRASGSGVIVAGVHLGPSSCLTHLISTTGGHVSIVVGDTVAEFVEQLYSDWLNPRYVSVIRVPDALALWRLRQALKRQQTTAVVFVDGQIGVIDRSRMMSIDGFLLNTAGVVGLHMLSGAPLVIGSLLFRGGQWRVVLKEVFGASRVVMPAAADSTFDSMQRELAVAVATIIRASPEQARYWAMLHEVQELSAIG